MAARNQFTSFSFLYTSAFLSQSCQGIVLLPCGIVTPGGVMYIVKMPLKCLIIPAFCSDY